MVLGGGYEAEGASCCGGGWGGLRVTVAYVG